MPEFTRVETGPPPSRRGKGVRSLNREPPAAKGVAFSCRQEPRDFSRGRMSVMPHNPAVLPDQQQRFGYRHPFIHRGDIPFSFVSRMHSYHRIRTSRQTRWSDKINKQSKHPAMTGCQAFCRRTIPTYTSDRPIMLNTVYVLRTIASSITKIASPLVTI